MSATTQALLGRGAFQGVAQIVRYNWHFYAGALVMGLIGAITLGQVALPAGLRFAIIGVIITTVFWSTISLAVSHYVYDRSPLYHFEWLSQMLPESPGRWINIHAGLDETSVGLRRRFPDADYQVLDIYEPHMMTAPAIKRARRLTHTQVPAVPASFRALPLADRAVDVAFVIFCAHELREAESRKAFFHELHRVLTPGGSVILVEHLRDWFNLVAFGPGFFHFFARKAWMKLARMTGFNTTQEVRLTAFVRAYRLERV